MWFWRTYITEIGEANMPWLPEDWIDEVISRNDIIDVVRVCGIKAQRKRVFRPLSVS